MEISSFRLFAEDAELAVQIASDLAGGSVSIAHLRRFLENTSNVLIAGVVVKRPVGFICGHILDRFKDERRKLFIYEVDVLDDFQRKGVGRAMMATLIEIARANGVDTAFVLTNRSNESAVGLYRAAGGYEVHLDDVMFEFAV